MPAEIIPLGARLRQRREELGLTQAQVARELDVARTAYRLWEKDAARPSPDRWRLVAKWLGLSVTAMLLAEELIDEQEAFDVHRAAGASGLTDEGWDTLGNAAEGDFFSQERAMIDDQARAGNISAAQASGLRRVLTRLQDAEGTIGAWHTGQFRKRFPMTVQAPALARAAVAATAVGIPPDALYDAALLTSELVTNSVTHSRSTWVEVDVVLTADQLRIQVSDGDGRPIHPRTADADGGWGLNLVAELATRWGVERHDDGKTIWIELGLPAPVT
jgi:transcriptional regulator with XRE-family HTH domain